MFTATDANKLAGLKSPDFQATVDNIIKIINDNAKCGRYSCSVMVEDIQFVDADKITGYIRMLGYRCKLSYIDCPLEGRFCYFDINWN